MIFFVSHIIHLFGSLNLHLLPNRCNGYRWLPIFWATRPRNVIFGNSVTTCCVRIRNVSQSALESVSLQGHADSTHRKWSAVSTTKD